MKWNGSRVRNSEKKLNNEKLLPVLVHYAKDIFIGMAFFNLL